MVARSFATFLYLGVWILSRVILNLAYVGILFRYVRFYRARFEFSGFPVGKYTYNGVVFPNLMVSCQMIDVYSYAFILSD